MSAQLSLFDGFEGTGTAPDAPAPFLPMHAPTPAPEPTSAPAPDEPDMDAWLAALLDSAEAAEPPPPAIQMTQRKSATPPHFYRCAGCLNTFTVTDRLTDRGWSKYEIALCVCGSERVEYLGQSTVDQRLQETRELCACDHRCTEARGPNCTCKCGGINHGNGLMITVIRDKGPIPKLESPSPIKWRRTRDEWIDAQKAAEDRMEKKHGQNLADLKIGRRIEYGAFSAINADRARQREAGAAKTHAGRMKKIAQVAC